MRKITLLLVTLRVCIIFFWYSVGLHLQHHHTVYKIACMGKGELAINIIILSIGGALKGQLTQL